MDKDGWSGLERPESDCTGCGRALAGLETAFATLAPEGPGFRRRDYCGACFENLPQRPFSFWKRSPAAMAADREKRESREDRRSRRRRDLDSLVELFERLSEPGPDHTPEKEKLRYLLALALCRRKRLHLVELARKGGVDCLIIRTSGEADLVSVPAPELSREDLERLASELEGEVGLS